MGPRTNYKCGALVYNWHILVHRLFCEFCWHGIWRLTLGKLGEFRIYLDFRKAFDSVPHSKLLAKLPQYRITGSLWYWFSNYLHNCIRHVKISSSISDPLPVSGVPQGSSLGPLLFLLYINDIPSLIHFSKPFLFADDAKLLKIPKKLSDHSLLQQDLDQLYTWTKFQH